MTTLEGINWKVANTSPKGLEGFYERLYKRMEGGGVKCKIG